MWAGPLSLPPDRRPASAAVAGPSTRQGQAAWREQKRVQLPRSTARKSNRPPPIPTPLLGGNAPTRRAQ